MNTRINPSRVELNLIPLPSQVHPHQTFCNKVVSWVNMLGRALVSSPWSILQFHDGH